MSVACPDWQALAAHRRDRVGEEPAAWSEALAHLDGCADCRRAAPAADPTLLFRRLARVEAPVDERAEVEAVLQGVAALRAAGRVARRSDRSGRGRSWGRWAAAAVLAFLALSVENEGLPGLRGAWGRSGAPLAAAVIPAALGRLPLLDGIEGPNGAGARIYQLEGEDLSVVMIVDESLDV